MRNALFTGILASAVLAASVSAATLSVGAGSTNNGTSTPSILMAFDLTNLTASTMTVTSFDTFLNGVAGSSYTLDLYIIHNSTYVGNTSTAAPWGNAIGTATGLSLGTTVLTHVDTPNFQLVAGETAAVAFSVLANGIRYNGTNSVVAQPTWSNGDLRLDGGEVGSGLVIPFGGGVYRSGRVFSGNVTYLLPLPAPGTVGALGAFGLFAARRRR